MPKVSVILPVYNGGKYLRQAVDSILAQTFTDFELLLLNDGSTDDSERIIQSYQDERIVYLRNEKNYGLIYTLNRGIDIARGEYIARMDADDIAPQERLEKQIAELEKDKTIGVIATTIRFMNEEGETTGTWALDQRTLEPSRIKRAMTKECCIAHPTIMARAELMKKYKYNPEQKNIEDYDLWLRMMSRGVRFTKLSAPAQLYRVHAVSVTQAANASIIPAKRTFHCKLKFLRGEMRWGRFSFFHLKVLVTALSDLAIATKKTIFSPEKTKL